MDWTTGKVVGIASAALAVFALGLFVYKLRKPPMKNSFYVALGSSFAGGLGLGERAPGSPVVSQRSVNGFLSCSPAMFRCPLSQT